MSRAEREQLVRVGEVELCYETFGEETAPPLLLVMGLASQMIVWEDAFCAALAAEGFRVIRFDNRDVGRSTILRDRPPPTPWQLLRRDPRAASYTLEAMADDTAGLLEALGIAAADVVGISMGGMISQSLAIRHPEKVRSLTSIMSTTGHRRVGRSSPRLYPRLMRRPDRDRAAYVRSYFATQTAISGRRFPPERARMDDLAGRHFDRGIHPAGALRQMGAIVTAADRTEALGRLRIPVTVIHGDADPLVHVSGGRATAAAIPAARLVIMPGMGHSLPLALWPEIVEAIVANARRVDDRVVAEPSLPGTVTEERT